MKGRNCIIILLWNLLLSKLTTCSYCHKYMGERNVPFCCNNSELKDGLCIECSPGFISVDGEPCKKCPIGRYGRKCIKRCSCKRNRCNNVHGCVDINHSSTETSSGGSTEIFKVTTVNSIITSTYNGYSEQIENSTASTYSFINTSEHEPTVSQNRKKRTQETVKLSQQGLLEREILVYSLCGAGFTICIVVCVACFCCKTRKRRKAVDISVREQNNENMNISDHNLLGSYDFIDEDDMLQLASIVKTRTESIISSNSYSFTVSTHSDGYLDPVPSIKISHSDTSKSDPDIKNENSGDIHPYQTIDHHPVEISHEYTTCGVVPDIELVDIGRSRKNGNSSNGGFQRRQTKNKHNLNNKMNIQKYHQSESDITKCTKSPCPPKTCRSSY
ncbi:uncharacterized protein LOC127716148 isoform X3 [Mytilus californianus]|uniref:uncharacterized protein LOC127716148 isoform X3 n=1 Tax=Mytilus californianus TaxID=6549 RepID=UPI00224801C9|nr:uncharacterized protein LOC127716148 isoform X3 [Mytilus californianus]